MDVIIPPHPTPPHPTPPQSYTFHVRWPRRAANVQEHSINVASHSSASVHGRYHPTPPHPTSPQSYTFHVRWPRRAANVQEHSINVASHSSASVHGRYHPTPPHPTPPHPHHIPIIYYPCMCGEHENRNAYTVVEIRVTKNMVSSFVYALIYVYNIYIIIIYIYIVCHSSEIRPLHLG